MKTTIELHLNDKEKVTLTLEEAEKVYVDLHKLFGEKAPSMAPVPAITPILPYYPPVYYIPPSRLPYGWEVTCSTAE